MSDDQTTRILNVLGRLELGQADLTARMDWLKTGQVQLRADLMARMDRLQNTVTNITNDMTVNMGRAD